MRLFGAVHWAESVSASHQCLSIDRASTPRFSTCSRKVEKDIASNEGIPDKMELVGLSFTSVGATEPPK